MYSGRERGIGRSHPVSDRMVSVLASRSIVLPLIIGADDPHCERDI